MRKTLSRRRKPFAPSLKDAATAFVKAEVSSLIALAVVIFAAGSVMAMTATVTPEVAMSQDTPNLAPAAVSHAAGQVLGQTLSIDAQLEAGEASARLAAKPVNFDATSGRWDYTISYQVNNLADSAKLTIGTYVLKDGITTSGSVDTGNILKPAKMYRVGLWDNGNKLASLNLRTGKGQTIGQLPCFQQSTASSTPSTSTSTPASLCGKPEGLGGSDRLGRMPSPGGDNQNDGNRLPPPPAGSSTPPNNQ